MKEIEKVRNLLWLGNIKLHHIKVDEEDGELIYTIVATEKSVYARNFQGNQWPMLGKEKERLAKLEQKEKED